MSNDYVIAGGQPGFDRLRVLARVWGDSTESLLRTVGVRGRDVVVPAVTFYATGAAVLHAGGNPVMADVDPTTLALSPATLEAALTPDTAAVVLVHIGGLITPEADALRERFGLPG